MVGSLDGGWPPKPKMPKPFPRLLLLRRLASSSGGNGGYGALRELAVDGLTFE